VADESADTSVRAATEEWFIGRGLPHFISDYAASTDIWTRALPALTLLVLAEVAVLAPNREFPIWLDVLVIVAAFVAVLGGWALVNRRRGRRPLQRPDDLGPVEIGAFVIGPALVPLVVGGQVRQAIGVAVVNVVLLALIYVGTSYGVVAIMRWALRMVRRQIETLVSLIAKALPMIALLVTFLFLTNEVWQTAGALDGPPYWVVVALFPIVGILFIVARLPRDVGSLNDFSTTSPDEFAALVTDTPMTGVDLESARVDRLHRGEWSNVGLVALFGQGVQILLVSVLIGAFFVVLGLLLVDEATTLDWARRVDVIATLAVGDRNLVLTTELLRVAGFLTAFAGLNFTVYLLTDATYRDEFRNEVIADLRQAFAVRAAYRRLGTGTEPSSTMSPT
jgi:hypothetical protein